MNAEQNNSIVCKNRLEIAAPYLFAACCSILETLEELELGDIGALDEVRSAIEMATGEQTPSALSRVVPR